jgi:CRP/FNR family transcriptional regulator
MDEQSIQQLSTFFSTYKKIVYKKREIILRAEDTPSGVYFIESGYVREYAIFPEGQELTLFLSNPKDVFPIRWTFTSSVNTKFFEAFTPTVVYRAPQEAFLAFLKQNPDLLFSFTAYTLTRWSFFLEKTEQLVYGSATGKIAYILLMLMQRHGKKEDGVWKIAVPFTHKDLGSLMGSTRETVSIEMQKLIKNGVITHEQQLLTIHDVAFLKNASQME